MNQKILNPNFDPKKTASKAKRGSFEGLLLSFVSLAVFTLLKRLPLSSDPDMETLLSALAAALAAGILQAGQKAFFNWKKHR